MSTAARLKLMEAFAISRSPEALLLFQKAFDNEHYRHIVRCRNTVAHGMLLGLTQDNLIAFQVQETQGFEIGKVVLNVNAYDHKAFASFANQAENIIPKMEEAFAVGTLRQTRRQQSLDPHLKSLKKARTKSKRQHR